MRSSIPITRYEVFHIQISSEKFNQTKICIENTGKKHCRVNESKTKCFSNYWKQISVHERTEFIYLVGEKIVITMYFQFLLRKKLNNIYNFYNSLTFNRIFVYIFINNSNTKLLYSQCGNEVSV